MRHETRLATLTLAAVVGGVGLCSSGCSGTDSPTMGPVVAQAQPPIVLPVPVGGQQVTFGPFSTFGADTQLCRTVKLDNDKPFAVSKFEVAMLEGSHHFILFKGHDKPDGTQVEYPDNVFDCKGTINFDEWDFLLDVNKKGGATWELGEGQAVVFRPHAQIMIQSHFVNSVNSQLVKSNGAYSVLNLHPMDLGDVKHRIQGMFTVNTRIAIPPHAMGWESKRRCSFSDTVHVVAMTGHFHEQGVDFKVDQMDMNLAQNGLIREVYCSGPGCADPAGAASSWDSPLFKTFEPPLLVNGNSFEGFEFMCSYNNTTDTTLYFGGLAATQEHCNLFFQYYVDQDKDSHLKCEEGSGGW